MLTEPLKTLTEPCLRHSNALRAWIMNSLVSSFCWWRDVGGRVGDFIWILLCCICCECVRSLCELGGRVGVFYLFLICCICFICVLSVVDYPVSTRWAGGCFFYKLFALFCIKYLLSLCTILAGVLFANRCDCILLHLCTIGTGLTRWVGGYFFILFWLDFVLLTFLVTLTNRAC